MDRLGRQRGRNRVANDVFAVAQNEFESAERDRGIVGHDLYGMVQHLYTPEDTGYTTRYTYRADLSNEEEDYVRRVESRSWLTFLDTNLFAEPIEVRGTAFSTGLNYYLAPFGDVIEWNTYVSSPIGNNRATIRAYCNHERFVSGLVYLVRERTSSIVVTPRCASFFALHQPVTRTFLRKH